MTATVELRPGRTYCRSVTSYECEAPAGIATGRGTASLPGVHRDDLRTCAYCGEKVCAKCSDTIVPPEFFSDQSPVPVCLDHDDGELAYWLGVES